MAIRVDFIFIWEGLTEENRVISLNEHADKSMVRPHLEYANSVWCAHKLGDIKEIEKVQRSLTIVSTATL